MAETNDGNIEFDVRAKLDKFENDLDDAESMIESTVSRIIGDAGEAQSKLEEKAKELAKAYEEAGMDSAEALRKAWADVRNDASESFKNTEDDINESLSGIGESASETGEEISETFEGVSENISDAFEGAEESADSFADNIKNVLAAVGIAYGAKEIVDIGVSYEKSMNKVANATGATNENLEQLKEITENVYSNNFGESMEDVASGVSEIYKRTGLVGDELQKVTESAYVLQDAFEYELNESTQAATQIMSSFGTTAEEAYNLIAQGAQKGLDQNGDMLDVINEYSVQFADMGYSAEDMFNMLANGVQNGVWSVDKLGDAIKEMHIRLSDGTADEVLQALKLGFAELTVDANELEKSALNLSKAEVSFSQAQQAVDEALSKSGSSSLEYQDALNKAKQAELDLKDAQEEYNTVASNTEYNLDAIKDKLSAGGEDAKEAIQDIMTALSQVEDEQERYVLGQTIMGTMWEDLGEDAVNALMNTQGEISKTKDSLSEISEIQYDDLGTKLSALQRKIETEVVLPIAKKAVPKIEKAIEYVAENLDEIIDKAKPVAAGIATAFAITKVVEFGSTAVKVAKTVKGAFTVSNLTNPLGWIALGVTAVAALASAAKKQSEEWKKHLEDVREEAAKIPDELQKSIDSTKECVDEWENLKKQSKETKLGEDIDFNNIKDLEASLLSLINADGTVKTGAEAKVTELIDEINQYSDTALTVSDGVILKNDEVVGSYDKIAESIDAVIEKQHAQNYLDALSDMSKEAQLSQPKLQENIATENKHLKEYKSEREEILREIIQMEQEYGDYVGKGEGAGGSDYVFGVFERQQEYEDLMQKLDGVDEKIGKTATSLANSEATFKQNKNAIIGCKEAAEAFSNGDYSKIGEIYNEVSSGMLKATNATTMELQIQARQYKDFYDYVKKTYEERPDLYSQEDVDNASQLLESALFELGEKYGTQGEEGAKKYVQSLIDMGLAKAEDADKITAYIGEKLKEGADLSEIGKELGGYLMDGVDIGIQAGVYKVVNSMANAALSAISSFNNAAEIKSPSRKMIKSGGYLDEGLAIGIEDGISDVSSISAKMADEAVAATMSIMNSQALNSVAPYSPVFQSINYDVPKNESSQTVSNNTPIQPNIIVELNAQFGDEQLEPVIMNTITRANASTGGYSV